jgi:hypothetical protein
MFHAIADGFNYLWGFLARLADWLLDGLAYLFSPIFDLLAGIFYFLYMIGVVLVKVVTVVLALGKLLIGLCTGLFKTITGLSFSGRPAILPDSYNDVFARLQPVLNTLQLDKVAYLITFAIWIATAFASIKIIGNMRGGGGEAD